MHIAQDWNLRTNRVRFSQATDGTWTLRTVPHIANGTPVQILSIPVQVLVEGAPSRSTLVKMIKDRLAMKIVHNRRGNWMLGPIPAA